MASSNDAKSRSIIPRLVRLLSTVHGANRDKTAIEFAWSTAFSRRHFPKTLAVTCALSFSIGFYGMNKWQQKRQWKWEKYQLELEREYYKIDMRKHDSVQRTKSSVLPTSI